MDGMSPVLRNQLGFQCASLDYAHCNLEHTFMFLLSVICYPKRKHGSSGVVPLEFPSPGDPESRREIGCGLDEAACEFSGIGHGSIIWKLKARTMHARGHKISNNSPGCFLLVA